MKRNINLAIPAIVIAALGIAAFSSCSWWQGESGNTLKLYGNIELTQIDVAFKIPGKLAERTVDEGDPVQKGKMLGRLDTLQLEHQHSRDRAALEAAESQVPQLETAIERQRATLAADSELRQAQLKQAEARLQELLAGSRKQEIAEAQAAVDAARTQNEQARLDWERAQVLYKNDDISTSQYDQFRTKSQAAAASLKQAEERFALVVEGPRKENIEAAQAQVEQARASLKLAETAALELKRLEQELQTRHAQVRQAQAQVGMVEAQLADGSASCPVNGVVLVKSAEVGDVLAAGTPFLTVGELDRPWMRAYINETDLGRVKLGSKVRITTDSFPGKVYWGRVSFIASEAEFTPKQIQTTEERVKLVYRIKVEVENPEHELKLNMPVEAEVILAGNAPQTSQLEGRVPNDNAAGTGGLNPDTEAGRPISPESHRLPEA